MELKVTDKAPDFKGIIQDGSEVSLSDYKGVKLILFFYPKDNTPGCTAEACNLSENYSLLKEKGFELLGVSPDTEKKHQNFIAKKDLTMNLVADVDKVILEKGNLTSGIYFIELKSVTQTLKGKVLIE